MFLQLASASAQVLREDARHLPGDVRHRVSHAANSRGIIMPKAANQGAGTSNVQMDWLGLDDKERVGGGTSPFRAVLTNISDGVTVTFSSIASDDPTDFTVSMDCKTLAPGQSCNAFFSFNATSVCQAFESTITITDDDPAGSVSVDVEGFGADSGLQVDDLTNANLTATALAQSLVGQGVTVSNVTVTGAPRAIGNFQSSSNIIGFNSGVVLSTGSVRNVVGPNCSTGIDGENGFAGDPDLDNLVVESGQTTNDAAILEFDFVPTNSVVSFQYVFSSDEYNEFVFQFNDVFGFFLNGNNIALIPGTNTPVSINNVNGGNPLGTGAVNAKFYINNDFQFPTGAPVDTEMDGLTVVFTASGPVTPNTKNHIKLAIADAGDFQLDSNVFIKAGSFISSTLTLTPSPVNFGNQAVGTTSASQAVTITNVGGDTVTIGSIAASANFTQTNTCPATLAPVGTEGSSCTANVSFVPTTAGALTGTLTVTFTTPTNQTPQTQTANLTGTGTGAANATLTVAETGTGTGTVTSSPAGISCKPTCSASFASGTVVTLTATPATGSTFTGWTDATCEGTGTCTLTLTTATTVTANFGGGTTNFALTVTEAGTGTGTVTSSPAGISCKPTCSANFAGGTAVTLTATPATGSTFTGWSAPCEGTGTCTVTVTAATTVTATFGGGTSNFALTVTEAGTGTGTVTSAPAGINCKPTCSANFASGTQVTLSQSAAEGSVFAGWSGACTGTGACVVAMTAAESVTATFNNSSNSVIISVPSGGSTTASTTPGGTAFFGLLISGAPGVTGTVQLNCAPSIPVITCKVVPNTVTLNGNGTTEVAFGIQTFCQGSTTAAGFAPAGFGGGIAMFLMTLMVGGIAGMFNRDRRIAVAFAMLVMFVTLGVGSCASLPKGANGATQPGTYFITLSTTLNGQTQTFNNFLTLMVKQP